MLKSLLEMEHGWLARHPTATALIVLAIVILAPGVIECL